MLLRVHGGMLANILERKQPNNKHAEGEATKQENALPLTAPESQKLEAGDNEITAYFYCIFWLTS